MRPTNEGNGPAILSDSSASGTLSPPAEREPTKKSRLLTATHSLATRNATGVSRLKEIPRFCSCTSGFSPKRLKAFRYAQCKTAGTTGRRLMQERRQQTDLFRLDWLPVGEAARLCGLDAQWLTDELLAGHLRGISTKVMVGKATEPGLEVWLPSIGMWLESHRESDSSTFPLLRRNGDKP